MASRPFVSGRRDRAAAGGTLFALLLPVMWAVCQWLGGAPVDAPEAPAQHSPAAVHPHLASR